MISVTDIAVVGGGPAGTSAAIWAALSGRSVVLVERSAFPRARPGETLHPGVESIFRQLGVLDSVEAACTCRFAGIVVNWGGQREATAFGRSGTGEWLGYQIDRGDLDAILIARARELGVVVLQPCRALDIRFGDGLAAVSTSQGVVIARYVIDASGQANWIGRKLRLDYEIASPPLRARYGYCIPPKTWTDCRPHLSGDVTGWWWSARVSPTRLAWARLNWSGHQRGKPDSLADLLDVGRTLGADVTWKRLFMPAGSHYFVCGDAAAVLDPASSHGVLKAAMSGMMAAYQASAVLVGLSAYEGAARYVRWLESWWKGDVVRLNTLYRQLDSGWNRPPR
ncbi:NAD(P)/FAD-dependent oxidoreductase [Burkholderia sp. BCC1977]|uniref:NAD(P)/FAD-dependent oxidoreductase n=1 Tax=Burkholderia sp. BCC1977 TaxID=2817440 RepID=UPI002ABE79E5|nr:tryptophan 7-halogenase [Burkholderia sp. BCC1977]